MVGELYTYQMLGYKRIALYLTIRQKGLCYLCSEQIGKLSPIVKNKANRRAIIISAAPEE